MLGGTARAQTTIIEPPEARWPFQAWIDGGLLPTPTVTISVVEEDIYSPDWPCGESGACVEAAISPIYFGTIWRDAATARPLFWHEMGHEFDAYVLSEAQRARLMVLLGFRDVPWWGGGEFSAAEEFANVYSDCATRRSMWTGNVSRLQRRLCHLIARMG